MTSTFPLGRVLLAASAIALIVSMYRMDLLDPAVVVPAVENLWEFAQELFPPNWDVLPALIRAMGQTIEIAFVGTALGFIFSLPLAFLASRTLFGTPVTLAARAVIAAVRTIPSLLWAVIFVVGFGLGPAAGALGVAAYSIGYLGKLYYEAFEAVDGEVLEAVRSVGASRPQLFAFAILPESANAVISQLLFMFDYNVRASAIMGFVGAGGIGFYILGYLQLLQYQNLMTALLLLFVVVMAIDFLSGRLRAALLAPKTPRSVPILAGVVP